MRFYIFLPLLAFFFNAFLLFLLLRVKRKSSAHWVFGLYLVSMVLWAGTIYAMRSSPDLERAYQWEKAVLPVFPLTTVSVYHFVLLFTRSKRNRRQLSILYLFLILLIAVAPTPLVLQGMQVRAYGYAPIIGPLFFPWVACVYAPYVFGFFRLITFVRTAPSYNDRNRALYIIIGTSIGFVGATTDYLAALSLFPYPGGIIGNLLFALIATVAVVRLKLLDMRLMLRRGLGYLLVVIIIVVPYLSVVVLINRMTRFHDYSIYVNVALLLLLAAILYPLLRLSQELMGKLFYQKRYDYFQALRRFSQEASSILNIDEVNSSLVRMVGLAMETDKVYLMLLSPGKGMFSTVPPAPQEFVWNGDSPLATELKRRNEALNWEELQSNPHLQALTEGERESLDRMEAELVVPLKTENNLAGVLVLGPSKSGQPYGQEEIKLLMEVATQVAIAIENAQLYGQEKARVSELQHLDQLKSDFFLAVAHHLKTPITVIKASLGMLEEVEEIKRDDRYWRLVGSISRGAQSLEREITELLEFLKIRTASVELDPQPMDLKEFLINTSTELLPALGRKNQNLEFDLPDQFPRIMLDAKCLERIFFNLLTNAHKFAPSGSEIKVSLKQGNGELMIAVKDDGPGIPPNEQTRIFEAYYQIKGSAAAAAGGSGLGLAICKSLIELQGGRIWVESNEGKGSVFSFSLPLVEVLNDGS